MLWNPRKAIKTSFRVKILLISVFFLLLTCFLLSAFFVYQQSSSLNDELIKRAILLSSVLAQSTKVGVFAESRELLEAPVESVAQQEAVKRVSVFNNAGGLLYTSPGMKEASAESLQVPDEEIFRQLQAGRSPVFSSSPDSLQVWTAIFSLSGYTNAEALFYRSGKSRENGRKIGYIAVTVGKDELHARIYGFLWKAGITAASAAVIGSLLIYMVIRGIVAPLDRLTHAIKALGSEAPVAMLA